MTQTEATAKKLKVSPAYLRRALREGCSYILAVKLSRLTGERIDCFLFKQKGGKKRAAVETAGRGATLPASGANNFLTRHL